MYVKILRKRIRAMIKKKKIETVFEMMEEPKLIFVVNCKLLTNNRLGDVKEKTLV